MGCITADNKKFLLQLLDGDTSRDLLKEFVGTFAICPEAVASGTGNKPHVERSVAGRWPEANYYDKKGKVTSGSFSGLFKDIYGTPVTEDLVCRWWGDRSECRSPSTVENFRNRGDIVKGNGGLAPVPTINMSAGQVERLYGDWKDKLLSEGRKIHIYHPENPAILEATKIVEKTAKK